MNNYYLIPVIVTASLIVALDPLVISVFAALVAGSKGFGHNKNRQFLVAMSFIFSYMVLISLIGVALIGLLSIVPYGLFVGLVLAVAVLAVLWGLTRIKNYFWHKPFGGIPKATQQILHKRTMAPNSAFNGLVLAVITAYASLINIIIIIGSFSALAVLLRPGEFWIAGLIGLVISMPLIVFYFQIHRGLKISTIIKWKEDNKHLLELSIGCLSVFLGWLIFLSLNGVFYL